MCTKVGDFKLCHSKITSYNKNFCINDNGIEEEVPHHLLDVQDTLFVKLQSDVDGKQCLEFCNIIYWCLFCRRVFWVSIMYVMENWEDLFNVSMYV